MKVGIWRQNSLKNNSINHLRFPIYYILAGFHLLCTHPCNSCPNQEYFRRSYFEATYAVYKYIQNESSKVWWQEKVSRDPHNQKTSFNSWEGTEVSHYQITQGITLMYSLGWLQRSLCPSGLPFTLQLNRETPAQTSPKLAESQICFPNTYSTYLVFLKDENSWKAKGASMRFRKKNGHKYHNTLVTFTCNHYL